MKSLVNSCVVLTQKQIFSIDLFTQITTNNSILRYYSISRFQYRKSSQSVRRCLQFQWNLSMELLIGLNSSVVSTNLLKNRKQSTIIGSDDTHRLIILVLNDGFFGSAVLSNQCFAQSIYRLFSQKNYFKYLFFSDFK